ncbi:MAG TPA: protein kinase, partial [Streptosporangiaceae bacterium]|nr:protein kinase [Streptosporangiaceae bacterium]
HMHGKGMIHRDVAAANIWLDERHSPHLGDFDLAVLREAQSDSDSRSVSTEGYAAPERAAGGPVDERSDLYSLGAVLYEAVTGRRAPCEGPQRNAEIAGCLAARRPVLPHRLTDVICRLLAESPQDRPDSAQEVLDALKVTRDPLDSEDAWTGTLPFPLASVLWLYLAEPEPATKVEFLLRFFESLAQFSATVLLSAGMSDPVFSTANRSEWFGDPDGPRPLDLRIPTFGTWVELTKRLASTGRQMLEGHGDETDHYLKLFTATDADLIEALVSKKLDEILRHACVRRNEWIGHGGRTNPKVLRDRLGDLEEVLARTRSLFAWSFMPWTLVKPGASMSRHGVHVLTATILTGANAAFRKRQIELSHPCDAELLYFQNRENPEALAVAPLIRMISDDDTGEEACYFYNRAEGDQVRWVSYHYLGVPERRLPDEDVLTFISTLAP